MMVKFKVIAVHAMKVFIHKSGTRFRSNGNYSNVLIKREAMYVQT